MHEGHDLGGLDGVTITKVVIIGPSDRSYRYGITLVPWSGDGVDRNS